MAAKRASPESDMDEQTIDPLTQQKDNAKRVKLSDRKLQDLPIELLERILVEAVETEVRGMKLIKSTWKAKADLVISRLRIVCKQWKNILATVNFQQTVNRILNGTAQERLRMDMLHQSQIDEFVFNVSPLKDELFMLCVISNQYPVINVYDCDHMFHVKEVIPLPTVLPVDMAACNVSNCVYLLTCNKESDCLSVLRITRDEQLQFNISPFINDLSMAFPYIGLFVSASGSIIILSKEITPEPSTVCIYNADGFLQHALTLFPHIHGFKSILSVAQKSNENLVLVTVSSENVTVLIEMNTIGKIVRKYRSSVLGSSGVEVVDVSGRIICIGNKVELLDSEFHLLDNLHLPQRSESRSQISYGTHYNRERNEMVRLHEIDTINPTKVLTIYCFTGQ